MIRKSLKLTRIEIGTALLGLMVLLTAIARLTAQTKSITTLTVRVTGARNTKGKIGVALFQDATGFPGDTSRALRIQQGDIDAQSLNAHVTFEGIPQGTYAVSVFHDENMNRKLDKNLVGVPKEGYGASNNPKKRMGPPRFEEAKFSVDQAEQLVEIKLIY